MRNEQVNIVNALRLMDYYWGVEKLLERESKGVGWKLKKWRWSEIWMMDIEILQFLLKTMSKVYL